MFLRFNVLQFQDMNLGTWAHARFRACDMLTSNNLSQRCQNTLLSFHIFLAGPIICHNQWQRVCPSPFTNLSSYNVRGCTLHQQSPFLPIGIFFSRLFFAYKIQRENETRQFICCFFHSQFHKFIVVAWHSSQQEQSWRSSNCLVWFGDSFLSTLQNNKRKTS